MEPSSILGRKLIVQLFSVLATLFIVYLTIYSPTLLAEDAERVSVQENPSVVDTTGDLSIAIDNLRNTKKGRLLVLLYNKIDRVEVDVEDAFKVIRTPLEGQSQTVVFNAIPHGDYAVAVLHDKDKDDRMDTNFIGIPKEDMGASNNARGGPLGGPKWSKAHFSVSGDVTSIAISMYHF